MSISRLVSAAVLIVGIGGTVLFLPPWATLVLAVMAAAAAGVELALLARSLGAAGSPAFMALTAAAFCVLVSTQPQIEPVDRDLIVALIISMTIASGLITLGTTTPGARVYVSIAMLLLAPLYVGLPLGTLAWIREVRGAPVFIWLVGVIALSDSAQYYAGTLWGRRKLAPVISPGKTVEGAVGGLVIAPVAGILIGRWAMPEMPMTVTAPLAMGLALFGMTGDLFESLIKRSAGAKDSSALIPGHGGVLDRIDAYLFAAPVFYLFLRYIA